MLKKDELSVIEKNYSLDIDHQTVKPLQGGDVNEAYQVHAADKTYLIKKIKIGQYEREYHATKDEIRHSLTFVEEICKEQQRFGNVVPALEGKSGAFIENNEHVYLVFPFVNGTVLENQAINNEMIAHISKKLFQIHHEKINYDQAFSKKKNEHYLHAAHTLINHAYWSKLRYILKYLPLFQQMKKSTEFILSHQQVLEKSVASMSLDSICHNDLKPKNVLWDTNNKFWIIDWEAACDFDHHADYLDTLLAWSIEEHHGIYSINPEKVLTFQQSYYISPSKLHDAINIVLLKWYFWLYFCVAKSIQHPTKFAHYSYHAKIALEYINLLIDKSDLQFLSYFRENETI